MEKDVKSRRKRERLGLSLPVQVYCRESADFEWKEMTRLVDITQFGAGLTLTHPTEQGRLILLTMNLPRQLRCYDHLEPQYKVWGVVRYSSLQSKGETHQLKYRVGVAFIGKHPPPSYITDPSKRYEVSSSPNENGVWLLTEPPTQPKSLVDFSGHPRRETRYTIQETVIIEAFDSEGNVIAAEQTITEDISRSGACVFTTLEINPGRFVRMTSLEKGISATAVVRSRRKGTDNMMRLHLEIIDCKWIIDGID